MNKRTLHSLTRSSSFLWKSSLALLTLFVVVSSILWFFFPRGEEITFEDFYLVTSESDFEIAINTIEYSEILSLKLKESTAFPEKLQSLKYLTKVNPDPIADSLPPREKLLNLSDSEYRILAAFNLALRSLATSRANLGPNTLLELAQATPPLPFANYAASLYSSTLSDVERAIDFAKAEIASHPSDSSRSLLISIYEQHSRYDELEKLQANPEFATLMDSFLRRDIALRKMDWPVLITTLLPVAYQGVSTSMLLLALLAGLAWASLVVRFSGQDTVKSLSLTLALPALLLGALSAHLTILAIYLQEDQFGLHRGDDLLGQVIYCVAGIALREEFLKLLCFIPLLPILLKRKNELEIFVVASLVGLGFAIEENISYLEQSQGLDAIGRFITANFFHLALTGGCGLALSQAFIYRGSSINAAASTFGIAVLAHGAYNAFIIVPELGDYAIASIIILILVSYQYFQWLREMRPRWNDTISLSSHFTFGLTLVLGASFLVIAWQAGPARASIALAEELLGVGLLLIMFYREIPEDLC